MKALTLTQPWATLVAIGAKRFETRSWGTRYRGPLAIHAAKGFPVSARELCYETPFRTFLARAGYASEDAWKELPRGAVVATCVLRDVVFVNAVDADSTERDFGDFSPGRFAWALADIVRLRVPYACGGALGLWEWDIAGPTAVYVKDGQEKAGQKLREAHWGSCVGRDRARADYPRRKP